ncbi:Ecdysone 20-monooxygenase [Orchesella cincta]|uniref:Ecdysone 20-monooxygenase n=1 Tax=Orchesella cincta TaxID=48709 RepID=A0A1D2NKK9_ORCCI|nr:Ecdysone 20-monooxygenase [Orchesella cincta]
MSKSRFQEENINNDWRIFQAADETLSLRRRYFAGSFDEYINGRQKLPHGLSHKDKSDTNNSNKFSTLPGIPELAENFSSSCEENERKRESEADDDESWGSLTSDDEDEKIDDVPKSKDDHEEQFRYTPYRSLTDILISSYCPEKVSEQGSDINPDEGDVQLLSLDEKVPVVHALNRLEDIDKVLKTGHLTTRMERIIEYKQEHPFDDGYDDEGKLNCCDWILYRLSKIYSHFCSTQWPN